MSADPLSPEAIAAVDSGGELGEILGLAEHLRDGLWRVQSANLSAEPSPGGLQVVGTDGLERGGHLAREALIPDLSGPIIVTRGLPTPEPLPTTVLLASYSGEDVAVLEAFALTRRARRVVLTTGGRLAEAARAEGVAVVPLPGGFPEPRLALGYPLVVCLELARLGGLAENAAAEVEAAAAHVARLARQWGPDSPEDSPAKRLARAAAEQRPEGWAMSAVEVGETPLARVATRLLLTHLITLYRHVLDAAAT